MSRVLKLVAVTLICGVVAVSAGLLLYRDLTALTQSHGKLFGKLTRKEAWVRRKPSKSYLWSNLQAGENLFRRDSVQVGPESSATIRLASGTVLELEENSLLVLDDSENFKANLLSGSFILKDATGDRVFRRDSSGKETSVALDVSLSAPAKDLVFTILPGQKHKTVFRWKWRAQAVSPETSVYLQWSTDRSFAYKEQQRAARSTVSAVVPLSPGKYFWRLATADRVISEVGAFRVLGAAIPTYLTPVRGAILSRWNLNEPVRFSWTTPLDDESIPETRLELSRSPDFKNGIQKLGIDRQIGSASVSGLEEGKWYWRLVGRYTEGDEVGVTESFEIRKSQKVAVNLVAPKGDVFLPPSQDLQFGWDASESGSTFEIQVKDTSKESGLWSQSSLKSSHYTRRFEIPGHYEWRVLARKDGEVIGESSWQAFDLFFTRPIALEFPAAGKEVPYVPKLRPVRFGCADVLPFEAEALKYRWTLAKDRTLAKSLWSQTSTKNQAVLDGPMLESGVYYWRVDVINSQGTRLQSSPVSQLVLDADPTVAVPELLGPGDGEILNLVYGKRSIRLSWARLDLAVAYLVKIFFQGKKIEERRVTETALVIPRLKEGAYQWQVEGIDYRGRLGTSSILRNFSVDYGPPLPAPKSVISEVK